jgi:DNA-binding transcriptional LysR family regulator
MPSPSRITLDQWRALVAVVDTGSYARAAGSLHKSQSSVTYAVQQIESQLGVEAFRIEGRKAVLTPTGDLLYRRARFLLDEAAALESSATRFSAGWEAEIRIACEVIFPPWLLLQALAKLGEDSPHTRVDVIESVLGHRTDALARRDVDLAIYGTMPVGHTGETLMRMRFLLCASPAHPLHESGRTLTMRDLRAYRHLLVRETSPDRAGPRSIESTQRWTFSQFATSIEAARRGHGYAWLPEERIRDELESGLLKPLPMREGNERFVDVYLLFADRENAGPATLRLAEILRATVAAECAKRPQIHAASAAKPAGPRAPAQRRARGKPPAARAGSGVNPRT